MVKNIITFGTFSKDLYYTENLHPVPMSKYKIEWYENIKPQKFVVDGYEGKTVKACPSFTEIYEEGFVVLAPTDYKITIMPDGQLLWQAARSFRKVMEKDDVEYHFDEQLVNYLPKNFDTKKIIKINTPWKAFTPKGYSVRIMKMPLTDSTEWENSYGVLRTDKNSHLNFQLNVKVTDKPIHINQGDPIGLLVPFKRDKYTSQIINLNDKNKYSIAYHKQFLNTYGTFKLNFRKDYWEN